MLCRSARPRATIRREGAKTSHAAGLPAAYATHFASCISWRHRHHRLGDRRELVTGGASRAQSVAYRLSGCFLSDADLVHQLPAICQSNYGIGQPCTRNSKPSSNRYLLDGSVVSFCRAEQDTTTPTPNKDIPPTLLLLESSMNRVLAVPPTKVGTNSLASGSQVKLCDHRALYGTSGLQWDLYRTMAATA